MKDTKWVRGHVIGWSRYEEGDEVGIDIWVNHPEGCMKTIEHSGRRYQTAEDCVLDYALGFEKIEEMYWDDDKPLPWSAEGATPQGEIEFEFRAQYGWSESTPVGPSEYEFEFVWRAVVEGRDEDIADKLPAEDV